MEKSQKFLDKVSNLISIKKPIIWIKTHDEEEVEILLTNLFEEMSITKVYSWTGYLGMHTNSYIDAEKNFMKTIDEDTLDHMTVIDYITTKDSVSDATHAFILKDAHELTDTQQFIRAMRDIREKNNTGKFSPIIAISPIDEVPCEWKNICEVINYAPPTSEEVENLVTMFEEYRKLKIDNKSEIEKFLLGFSTNQIIDLLNKSFYQNGNVELDFIKEQKVELIENTGLLTYKRSNITLDSIGGNENFKKWIEEVKICMTPEAVSKGIPQPKGYLSLGIPGTSKTLMAEALSGELNIPLLKFDMSKVLSKMVGESENNADKILELIKSCAPCALLIDECEKALGGINSSNQSDSGVVSRIFNKILEFLNDNSNVYVIMTSNDVSQLPPELTRPGRLDAIWYFGLPSETEREAIFNIHFRKYRDDVASSIIKKCAKDTEGYTGAEIEHIVKNIIKKAYVKSVKDGQDSNIGSSIVEDVIKSVIPVSKSYAEKIYGLEAWAKDRALFASEKVTRKRTTSFEGLL